MKRLSSDSDGRHAVSDRRSSAAVQRGATCGAESAGLPFTPPALSLRWNFSWIVVGNVVHSLSRWGILVVLTKLGSAAMTGRVVFGFAVCMPVFALGNLGLRSVLVTDTKREYGFSDYLRLRIITATSALATACLIGRLLLLLGTGAETVWIITAIAVGKLFESLSDVFHGRLQKHERMDRVAIALMIRGPAALLLFAVGMVATGSPLGGIVGLPLAMAATFFCWDLRSGSTLDGAWSTDVPEASAGGPGWRAVLASRLEGKTLARLAWLALPLGVVMLAMTLLRNIPHYFIQGMLGEAALGIFGSIGYLVMIGAMVVGAMGQSTIPRLARYYHDGRRAAFCRLLGKLLAIVSCLGTVGVVVMILAGGPLLGFFYDQQIADHRLVAICLMVYAAIMYLNAPLGRAVDAMRRFRTHMVIRTTGLITALTLLPGLIRSDGLQGAALAMIFSGLAMTVLFVITILVGIRRMESQAESTLSVDAASLSEMD